MKKNVLFSLFCLLLYSCNSKPLNYSLADAPLLLDARSAENILFDSVKKNVQYIPLETNEYCLIGEIDKVIIKDDKIFVADFKQSKSIFVFDLQGKFLRKIGRIGKAPGEYINLSDFDIHRNGDIYILDAYQSNILIFGNNGQIKETKRMRYMFESFFLWENSIYCSHLYDHGRVSINLSHYLIEKNKFNHLITDKGLFDHVNLPNFSTYRFYCSPSVTYYSPRYSEIVFAINEKGLQPVIGFTNLQIPSEAIINTWINNPTDIYVDHSHFKEITYVYETSDYISFHLINNVPMDLIYDKVHQKIYRTSFYNTIGISHIMGSTGKSFFGIMTPDAEHHQQILKQNKILSGLTETSNPVVVLFDFRM